MATKATEGRNLFGWIPRSGKKSPDGVQPKRSRGVMTLWGQEFNLVKAGLDEVQVVAYVEDLKNGHSGEIEKLQQQHSLPELAGEVIFEAEKLGESIREEERRRAAEQAANILFQAQMRSKEIIEEAERGAAHRFQESIRLSAEVVEEAREKTTLAEQNTIEQLPQQLAHIQSALQASIDQAYQKVFSDLIDLERDIQSRGIEQEPQSTEVAQPEESAPEALPEAVGAQPQPTTVFQTEEAPMEFMPEAVKDEPETPGSFVTELVPVEHEASPEVLSEESEKPDMSPELSVNLDASAEQSESTQDEVANAHDGAEEVDDIYNLDRDVVREKILESLQQAIELNGHGEGMTADEFAAVEEEQVSSHLDSEPAPLASGIDGDFFEGDLEFVMPPQRNER